MSAWQLAFIHVALFGLPLVAAVIAARRWDAEEPK